MFRQLGASGIRNFPKIKCILCVYMCVCVYIYIYLYMCLYKVKIQGKIHPRTGHGDPYGEERFSSTLSLTSALDGVGG